MSLDSCRTLFTLVPAAMSTSYIETVGTAGAAGDAGVDAERLERALERRHGVLLVAPVRRGGRRRPQQVERRQLVRAARGGDRSRLRRAGSRRARAPPRARAPRPAPRATPGGRPRSSSGTSRPSASRIESRPGLARRGARSSSGSSAVAPTGSRSGRDSRNSRIDSMMRETGVPVKIKSPSVANPRQTMPGADRREHAGRAGGQPARPPDPPRARGRSAVRRRRGCPRKSEISPRTPNTSTRNPMHIRTRSSTATSRSRTTPQ